ncbi:hypothetical protein [Niveibacterium sp.]|uniref:hypothetical protein n=1 Tax=Niveibacterium sp. TaxID=2017444 RepID=UPI0035B1083F
MEKRYRFLLAKAVISTAKRSGVLAAVSLVFVLARNHVRDVAKSHAQAVSRALWLAAFTAACVLLVWGAAAPGGELDRTDVALHGGALIAGAALLVNLLARTVRQRSFGGMVLLRAGQAVVLGSLLAGLAVLVLPLWRAQYAADPAGATLMAVLCVGLVALFAPAAAWLVQAALTKAPSLEADSPPDLSEAGQLAAARHEAGHALVYALAHGMPEDASAMLDLEGYAHLYGAVTFPKLPDPQLINGDTLRWRMYAALGGAAAERVFYGVHGLGSAADLDLFAHSAIAYVASGHYPGYHASVFPQTPDELSDRQALIGEMRDDILAEVTDFIALNRDHCDALAHRLLDVGFIGCEELVEWTARVQLPEGWERIRWPDSLALLEGAQPAIATAANDDSAGPKPADFGLPPDVTFIVSRGGQAGTHPCSWAEALDFLDACGIDLTVRADFRLSRSAD